MSSSGRMVTCSSGGGGELELVTVMHASRGLNAQNLQSTASSTFPCEKSINHSWSPAPTSSNSTRATTRYRSAAVTQLHSDHDTWRSLDSQSIIRTTLLFLQCCRWSSSSSFLWSSQ
jgi:hypothetical protein